MDSEPEKKEELETLGGVIRMMARHCKSMKRRVRNGTLNSDAANALTAGLKGLHAMLADRRDTKFQRQVNILWKEREQAAAQESAPEQH